MTACKLTACRICTGCYHGHPQECRGTVKCPTDGRTRTCHGATPDDEQAAR